MQHWSEQLFNLSIDMLCVAGFDGFFKRLNPAWERVLGYPTDELQSTPYLDFVHPEDRERTRAEAGQIAGGSSTIHFENRYRCKDGAYKWLAWTAAPSGDESLIYAVARDITEQRLAEEMLRRTTEHIRAILDNVADGIITLNDHGAIESANPNVELLLGYAPSEIAGRSVELLIAERYRGDFLRHLQSYLRPDKRNIRSGSHETVGRRRDGSMFPLEFIGSQMQVGSERFFIGTLRDISERRAEREALERRLLYDGLTGLPNRTLFADRLRQSLLDGRRDRTSRSLLLLDLDRFKEVNDTLGHERGDGLLADVARRLGTLFDRPDAVARLGGDEFAVVSSGPMDVDGAVQLAGTILRTLDAPFTVDGQTVDVRASIGIAVFPEQGNDAETLMRHADVAMYVAKRQQAGHAVYAPEHDSRTQAHLGLRGEFRYALEHGELSLVYQPIVDLRTGTVETVEALLRWRHPTRGLIPPAEFIPLIEATELMNPLTHWVLEVAWQQLAAWKQMGYEFGLAVNLSALNLQDHSLPQFVDELLKRTPIGAEKLTLEITETAIMAPGSDETVGRLSELGVALSIDDFGTGYSSLAYLSRLPVRKVKIDRSFVLGMISRAEAATIVRAIIELGHSLGLKVVAEGIESSEVVSRLRAFKCDWGQGYHICRPIPAAELADWFKKKGSVLERIQADTPPFAA